MDCIKSTSDYTVTFHVSLQLAKIWRTNMANLFQDLPGFSRGPGLQERIKPFIISVGFRSVVLYRFQEFFYRHKLLVLSYSVHQLNITFHGLDILPGAKIGKGLRIEHPVGIVIGAGVQIGRNCTIGPQVTLGSRRFASRNYQPKHGESDFPIIGDNVQICAKASILGSVRVGSGTIVAAHALVLNDTQENSLVVGIPAREIN